MLGRRFTGLIAEKTGQRPTVPPCDTTLTGDVLKLADEDHPKVDTRRQALASGGFVEGFSSLLELAIKIDVSEKLVQSIIKSVSLVHFQADQQKP